MCTDDVTHATTQVRTEFSSLFQFKAILFVQEMLAVIFAPFVLAFSLSSSSDRIIDFFQEFTVEVPGVGTPPPPLPLPLSLSLPLVLLLTFFFLSSFSSLGYVCSFSSFAHADKHASEDFGVNVSAPADMRTKDGKLEKSILTFKVNPLISSLPSPSFSRSMFSLINSFVKANNPKWEPSAQGEELLGNLSQFISTTASEPSNLAAPNHSTVHNFLQESTTSPTLLTQVFFLLHRPLLSSPCPGCSLFLTLFFPEFISPASCGFGDVCSHRWTARHQLGPQCSCFLAQSKFIYYYSYYILPPIISPLPLIPPYPSLPTPPSHPSLPLTSHPSHY